jgi:hypothetical protein
MSDYPAAADDPGWGVLYCAVTFPERSGRTVRSVVKAQPAVVQAPETAGAVARRLRLASPTLALALGGAARSARRAPGIVLLGLAILHFPDGRLPSSRLRWMVGVFAAVTGGPARRGRDC